MSVRDVPPVSRTVPALAALGLAAAVGTPAALPARADEVVDRPATGAVVLQGRGFGHGRGMSQWGAYGAASSGVSWPRILDFYYPGTVRTTTGTSTIKVWISGDSDGDTSLLPAPGLTVGFGATRRVLPAGTGYRRWRAFASGGHVVVQYLDVAAKWRPYPLPRTTDVAFTTRTGLLRLVLPSGSLQELRGGVHTVVRNGKAQTVLHSSMESYLRGVVPAEMPSSWHTEALAAQSVAARTYAASYRARQRARGGFYDICDTIACQVFKGVARYSSSGRTRTPSEQVRSTAAIAKTTGVVLRTSAASNASLVVTEFSASNGGYTVAGAASYQIAKADPYDAKMRNPNSDWRVTVPLRRLEAPLGVGALRSVQVVGRDGLGPLGGRVTRVRLAGTARSVEVSGTKMRALLGLRSDRFRIVATG